MQNIEIKAYFKDLEAAEQIARTIGAKFQWRKRQTDVYWQTTQGRLKLRFQEGAPAELIGYQRASERTPRPSNYELYLTDEPYKLQQVLSKVLVQDIVVNKVRTLFLWENVRIHLDQVEGLGNFIEFEAVVEGDPQQAARNVHWLMQKFSISTTLLIEKGYYELLKEGQGASQA